MPKFIKLSEISPRDSYRFLIGIVTPRPIGWISTVSESGTPNLAPFSFFNMMSGQPPILGFSPSISEDGKEKDTLVNVKQTKCFTHNVVTRELAEAMNKTAEDFPYGISEFEKAGLTAIPGNLVKSPRVKEAAISLECELNQIISFGNKPGSGQLVLGEIVAIHIADESVIDDRGAIDSAKLRVIARLGRTDYASLGEIFSMPRRY